MDQTKAQQNHRSQVEYPNSPLVPLRVSIQNYPSPGLTSAILERLSHMLTTSAEAQHIQIAVAVNIAHHQDAIGYSNALVRILAGNDLAELFRGLDVDPDGHA